MVYEGVWVLRESDNSAIKIMCICILIGLVLFLHLSSIYEEMTSDLSMYHSYYASLVHMSCA